MGKRGIVWANITNCARQTYGSICEFEEANVSKC